ncbi:hypothetical protein PR048_002163 [Dryococelus australis]|uniref:Uncharacterized protein n=1 Tax=Dryococelus australis TaxID=614101 RepID=A0ABQ9IJI6_9NEOP|nr:hypothetical protein PR048_002163 [Dryococelus australis]
MSLGGNSRAEAGRAERGCARVPPPSQSAVEVLRSGARTLRSSSRRVVFPGTPAVVPCHARVFLSSSLAPSTFSADTTFHSLPVTRRTSPQRQKLKPRFLLSLSAGYSECDVINNVDVIAAFSSYSHPLCSPSPLRPSAYYPWRSPSTPHNFGTPSGNCALWERTLIHFFPLRGPQTVFETLTSMILTSSTESVNRLFVACFPQCLRCGLPSAVKRSLSQFDTTTIHTEANTDQQGNTSPEPCVAWPQVRMEQSWNYGLGEKSDPRETPPTNGTIPTCENTEQTLQLVDTSSQFNNSPFSKVTVATAVVVRILTSHPVRIFACANRAGRCRLSAGFLEDLPFPPHCHSGDAAYSPRLALMSAFESPAPGQKLLPCATLAITWSSNPQGGTETCNVQPRPETTSLCYTGHNVEQ